MEGYKLETWLSYFKFSAINQKGPYKVEWFLYDENEREDIKPFTYQQLREFQDYVTNNIVNFEGDKNYFVSNMNEVPMIDTLELVPDERVKFPNSVILKPTPNFNNRGNLSDCMEILLTDRKGGSNHKYTLPFNVLGKIITN